MIIAGRFKTRQSAVGDKKKSKKSQKNRNENSTTCQTSKSKNLMNDRLVSNSLSCNEGNSSESAFQINQCESVFYNNRNKWGLIHQQIVALRVTWRKLCSTPHSACRGISAIMDELFNRLNEKNKLLRDIFYNAAFVNGIAEHRAIATLHDHSQLFISLISQIIRSLDANSNDIFKHINKIGLCHYNLTKYGFQQELWDYLGVELIDALVVQNCVRSYPGSCRAWTILIANLIDHLSAATMKQYRSKSTSTKRLKSTDHQCNELK